MKQSVQWTGHPLLDVGVATLCKMCGRAAPEDLTLDDLDRAADELESAFNLSWLNAYLTCLYPNGAFTNPTMGSEARQKEARRALRAHRFPPHTAGALRCVFSGQPAVDVLDRRHVPLLSGEGVISFTPGGLGGLAVADWISLALHAFALGARRALGRALAVHSDDTNLLEYFAGRNLLANRKAIVLARNATDGKYPDVKAPLTLVINTFVEAVSEEQDARQAGRCTSLTVLHLTNSGQGADIRIYELDSAVVRFLSRAQQPKYKRDFDALARRMWQRDQVRDGRGKKQVVRYVEPTAPNPEQKRNFLFEDLFRLPQDSVRFIRTHFLGRREYVRGSFSLEDPRASTRSLSQAGTTSWSLVNLFLVEVLGMEKKRIEAVRELGDRLAARVVEGDRQLFHALLYAKSYKELRARLVRAAAHELKQKHPLLVGFDTFLLVFEEGSEVVRSDWSLARDLLCIRVLEELHRLGSTILDTEIPDDAADFESAEGRIEEEFVS